jgi:CRP/FNR family transcriptional regulator, nitrogen oxide reductase regulator
LRQSRDALAQKKMNALEFRATHVPPNTEFLRGLEPQEINVILAAGKPRRFSAKCVMTNQGEPADHLLLLWKGRARYFFETQNGKKLNMRPITPGYVYGGAALVFRPCAYLVSSEAILDSVALVWDGPTIRGLARRFPRLLENALFVALDHISWYIAAYAALTSQTARERLAHVLVALAPSMGQKVSGGIELDVTNEELANSANISPYTTSRMISQWQRSGAIRKRRGKILLRSPRSLYDKRHGPSTQGEPDEDALQFVSMNTRRSGPEG